MIINEAMQQILLMTLYYAIFGFLIIMAVAFLLRGFFWKFIKVKMSFGKYIMIKVRSVLRDYYVVGQIDGSELIYKSQKNMIRLHIDPGKKAIYRSLMINFIDVDEEKNAICYADYSVVTGYDAKYYDNLYVWALTRPSLIDKKLMYIMVMIAFTMVLVVGVAYMCFIIYDKQQAITAIVSGIHQVAAVNGTVTPGV